MVLRNLAKVGKGQRAPGMPVLAYMTDETRDPDVMAAVARLPRGCLVMFRHYGAKDRFSLGRAVKRLCRRRRLIFLVAGDGRLARRLGADGRHLPTYQLRRGEAAKKSAGLKTAAVKTASDAGRARRAGCDFLLISPVFATRSHPGVRELGRLGLTRVAGGRGEDVLALGGMTVGRWRQLAPLGPAGFAGISGIG